MFHPGSSNLLSVLHFLQLHRHGVPPVESLAQLEEVVVIFPPSQHLLQLAGVGAEPAVEAGLGLDQRVHQPGQRLFSSHGLGEMMMTELSSIDDGHLLEDEVGDVFGEDFIAGEL